MLRKCLDISALILYYGLTWTIRAYAVPTFSGSMDSINPEADRSQVHSVLLLSRVSSKTVIELYIFIYVFIYLFKYFYWRATG